MVMTLRTQKATLNAMAGSLQGLHDRGRLVMLTPFLPLFHTRSHTDIPIAHFALMLKHAGYPHAIQNFPFSFFYPAQLYILTLLYELHVSGDCSQEGDIRALSLPSLTAFFIVPI